MASNAAAAAPSPPTPCQECSSGPRNVAGRSSADRADASAAPAQGTSTSCAASEATPPSPVPGAQRWKPLTRCMVQRCQTTWTQETPTRRSLPSADSTVSLPSATDCALSRSVSPSRRPPATSGAKASVCFAATSRRYHPVTPPGSSLGAVFAAAISPANANSRGSAAWRSLALINSRPSRVSRSSPSLGVGAEAALAMRAVTSAHTQVQTLAARPQPSSADRGLAWKGPFAVSMSVSGRYFRPGSTRTQPVGACAS